MLRFFDVFVLFLYTFIKKASTHSLRKRFFSFFTLLKNDPTQNRRNQIVVVQPTDQYTIVYVRRQFRRGNERQNAQYTAQNQ